MRKEFFETRLPKVDYGRPDLGSTMTFKIFEIRKSNENSYRRFSKKNAGVSTKSVVGLYLSLVYSMTDFVLHAEVGPHISSKITSWSQKLHPLIPQKGELTEF